MRKGEEEPFREPELEALWQELRRKVKLKRKTLQEVKRGGSFLIQH